VRRAELGYTPHSFTRDCMGAAIYHPLQDPDQSKTVCTARHNDFPGRRFMWLFGSTFDCARDIMSKHLASYFLGLHS
jgi:hypothetical protein